MFIMKTPEDVRYVEDPILEAKMEKSMRIDDIGFTPYDVVFLTRGWGAAYDLGYSPVLGEKVSEAYYAKGEPIIGDVCYGVRIN